MAYIETAQRRLTILNCDPDVEFMRRAGDALRAAGHHVLVAPDRSKAIELLLGGRRGVVIVPSVAFNRPESEHLAPFIHGLPERPAVIITMTLGRFDLAQQAWQLGADEAVFKPLLDDTELTDAVNRAMDKVAADESVERDKHNQQQR
ncbi:MAG TPA: response regulator [Phycisphaerales bacterium]|mgnify:CR=1 FL=1|nr:response regulator [Phycisphaerales bacterium]